MNAMNVTAAKPNKAGAIFNAPIGTVLPKDTDAALDKAFANLGYISEDGVTNSNSPSSDNIKAWGGDIVLSSQTEKPDEWKFKLIEANNTDVLKVIYGDDNVSGTLEEGLQVTANSNEVTSTCWVIDTILKNGTKKRIVIPDGKISSIGDIVYKDNEPVGYELTITAVPDTDGNTHYEYTKEIKATSTAAKETNA